MKLIIDGEQYYDLVTDESPEWWRIQIHRWVYRRDTNEVMTTAGWVRLVWGAVRTVAIR